MDRDAIANINKAFRVPASTRAALEKGVRQVISGMSVRQAEFQKKKQETEDAIKRGARQTDHRLPL